MKLVIILWFQVLKWVNESETDLQCEAKDEKDRVLVRIQIKCLSKLLSSG